MLCNLQVVCLPNWKEMYAALKEMKHRLSGEESDVGYYYKLCYTIETELQVLNHQIITIKMRIWEPHFIFTVAN